ncbi:MAG: 30S ribosomal protein S20 [Pseudomonadota bacterium]
MANSPQARKRVRQANKARRHNASQRSMVRTYIKRVRALVAANDADGAKSALEAAIPVIDRMVNKGILHKNAAARQKSRLHAAVKTVAQG